MGGALPPPPTGVIGFAHRGARLEHPDNSLDGFARARQLGATALETDAWSTTDGVAVLDHDGVVRRGLRRRPIPALPDAAVPPRLARLDELYARCGPDVDLSVDVKDPAAAGPVLAAARGAGATGRLWLCSPDRHLLAAWRTLDPEVHLVHSTALAVVAGDRHPERLAPADLATAVRAHARDLLRVGVGTINLHHRSWSPAAVSAAQGCGVAAFGWDAQRRVDLERAAGLGLDAVYSDDVALMVEVVAGSERPEL